MTAPATAPDRGRFARFVTAEEAAALVADGQTVAVSASSGVAVPDRVLAALGARFDGQGSPRDLTLVFPINVGDGRGQPGLDHLARPGMASCLIGGSYPTAAGPGHVPEIRRRIAENAVRAYNYPIGHMMGMLSESASRGVGYVTATGLGTVIDPRHGGGGLNPRSRDAPVVRRTRLGDREVLHYPPLAVDVAIIRASRADEAGNLSMDDEAAVIAPFTLAAAARASGGKVIAQVRERAAAGSLNPRSVKVPGYMVDAIVVVPDQLQVSGIRHDPTLSGQAALEPEALPPPRDALSEFVMMRASGVLRTGDVAVVGFGICDGIPAWLARQGRGSEVRFVIEQGAVDGLPASGALFGCAHGAAAYLDASLGFQYLRGGGFDIAMLSFLQIDGAANVNVSTLPSRPEVTAGIGGFMEIVHNARRLVFVGQLRGGGALIEVGRKGLSVQREGRHPRLVGKVDAVTVPGEVLRAPGRSVRIVTERCTFEVTGDGLRLVEVLKGVTPDRIRSLCEAEFRVADRLVVSAPTDPVRLADPGTGMMPEVGLAG